MALRKFWIMAYRDLGRNRRRSLLTGLAVALGVMLLIIMSGFIAGVLEGSLQNSIRLRTGHVQLRNANYQEEKASLLWQDLLENASALQAQAAALPEVQTATPVLWAPGVLSTVQETTGLQVSGIETTSPFYAPIRQGVVAGEFLAPGDRGAILIGERLAEAMDIGVGQRVSLTVGSAEGSPDEGVFTVKGLFGTGVPGYDQGSVFMPLDQLQAFTRAGDRSSAIVIMLHDQDETDAVAAALRAPGVAVLTWEDINAVLLETVQAGMAFYYVIYLIVILVVAVIIANTLLMAVFERTREMGILAALGMKRRQIMLMFLLEATILALAGIALGLVLGSLGVGYLSMVGISMGDAAALAAQDVAVGSTLYGEFVPAEMIGLSLATFIVVLLAALYPAWYAARLEPVKALHAL